MYNKRPDSLTRLLILNGIKLVQQLIKSFLLSNISKPIQVNNTIASRKSIWKHMQQKYTECSIYWKLCMLKSKVTHLDRNVVIKTNFGQTRQNGNSWAAYWIQRGHVRHINVDWSVTRAYGEKLPVRTPTNPFDSCLLLQRQDAWSFL